MLGSYPQTQPQPGGVGGLQGSRISLISKSDIRYEGYLYSINPDENTVALRNVQMLGTEDRKIGAQIPKGDQLYEFIIFRGSDIKDLTVFDTLSQRPTESSSHPRDPAILNAWKAAPSNNNYRPKPQNQSWGNNNNNNRGYQQNRNWDNQYNNNNRGGRQPQRYDRKDDRHDNRNYDRRGNDRGYDRNYRNDDRRQGRDDRGLNQRGRLGNDGGRSRGYSSGVGGGYNKRRNNSNKHTGKNFLVSKDSADKKKEFTEDFNFEENNKKLDLDKVANEFKEKAQAAQTTEDNKVKAQFSTSAGYDKTKSFFDEISCEALERKIAGSEPKRLDRETREQQKQLDQETFGTSNLADAGGYGYGPRRGGFRGRRSGGQNRNYGGRY